MKKRIALLLSGAAGCLLGAGHQKMQKPKESNSGSGQGSGALIYVVDDEPMLLELAAVILEPLGYKVETYNVPEAALRAFKAADPQPALIITDFAMHTMTGLQLLAACRQIRPRQKVVMVSGTVGPEIIDASPVKPDRFLPKPYEFKQLVDTVEAMLAD